MLDPPSEREKQGKNLALNGFEKNRRQLNSIYDKVENKLPQRMEVFGKPNVLVSNKGIVDGRIYHSSLSQYTSE